VQRLAPGSGKCCSSFSGDGMSTGRADRAAYRHDGDPERAASGVETTVPVLPSGTCSSARRSTRSADGQSTDRRNPQSCERGSQAMPSGVCPRPHADSASERMSRGRPCRRARHEDSAQSAHDGRHRAVGMSGRLHPDPSLRSHDDRASSCRDDEPPLRTSRSGSLKRNDLPGSRRRHEGRAEVGGARPRDAGAGRARMAAAAWQTRALATISASSKGGDRRDGRGSGSWCSPFHGREASPTRHADERRCGFSGEG